MGAVNRAEGRIFVSYSHKDRPWLEKLQVAIAPLLRSNSDLILWDDSRIEPGQDWQGEIGDALQKASVAVLLVSQNFLASDFIAENELPPLLHAASERGVRILWIPVGACLYQESPLTSFQAAWDPSQPLNGFRGPKREHAMVVIAEAIRDAVTQPRRARVDPDSHGADLLKTLAEDAIGGVPVIEDWYAIPWSKVMAKTAKVECAVSYMDTWINNAAGALEDLLDRDGTIRFFLPKPGTPAAERVVERFPEYDVSLVEKKIVNTREKLRGLRHGKGRVEVRWTEVFNMHCLMVLDDSVLLVSPYDHFRNSRIQNPTFVIPLWQFPMIETWIRKEFKGFQMNSAARLPSRKDETKESG